MSKTSHNHSAHPQVFLGLGANLGDPVEQIRRAVDELRTRKILLDPIRKSSLYRSPPWGEVKDQPWFVNAVVAGQTTLSPNGLLAAVKSIEKDLGRGDTGPRRGPREIDVDILLYGDEVVHSGDLVIPHPYAIDRPFVLVPLYEIAPTLEDPTEKRPYSDFLNQFPPEELDLIEELPDTLD